MTHSKAITDEPQVILVDRNDTPVGKAGKMEAHRKSLLHRAVSVFVVTPGGEWIVQRRAFGKYHSKGLWTNTCCTHPHPGESSFDSARRRLREEMGIDCELREIFSFVYKEKLEDDLYEHEFDHVFTGVSASKPKPDRTEVEEWKAVPFAMLEKDIMENPGEYTVWFRQIFRRVHDFLIEIQKGEL